MGMTSMDILTRAANGTMLDSDIPHFRTTNQLMAWANYNRAVVRSLGEIKSDEERYRILRLFDQQINNRKDVIAAEAKARKDNMPARNLDLIVNPNGDLKCGMKSKTAAQVGLLLECFDDPSQMTAYEIDAYQAMGESELDRQGVETLYDLFGTEFANAFYSRKNKLLAKKQLDELYVERARIDSRIARLERQYETGVVE